MRLYLYYKLPQCSDGKLNTMDLFTPESQNHVTTRRCEGVKVPKLCVGIVSTTPTAVFCEGCVV